MQKAKLKYGLFVKFLFLSSAVFGQQQTEISAAVHSELSESEIRMAETLSLSVEEIGLLENLKHSYQGMLSSKLSPLEWLGIFATTDAQRKKYAELLAERQISILTAISKFETAYLEALKNFSQLENENSTAKSLSLITPFSCRDDEICKENLQTGLDHLELGHKLDIYIKGTTTNAELRLWVTIHKISLEKIRSNQITINHADSRLFNLENGIYVSE